MGRHKARTDLGREFGATDVVAARGEEGVNAVRELTGGHGTHSTGTARPPTGSWPTSRCRKPTRTVKS